MWNALLIGAASLAAGLFGLRRAVAGNPAKTSEVLRIGGAALALMAAVAAAFTGRPLIAIALGLLAGAVWTGRLPLGAGGTSRRFSSGSGDGRSSSIRTAFLEMTLDHRSRAVNGRVLAGAFAGRELSSLNRRELATLHAECRAGEAQSRAVLEAYLDRAWPQWRQDMRAEINEPGRSTSGGAGATSAAGRMKRAEALEVLGLTGTVDDDAIRSAHRNLMKRFHPDQGGSTWLAARINEAKDVLLGK